MIEHASRRIPAALLPRRRRKPQQHETRLSDLLGTEEAGRAHSAADTLRLIFDIRAGQQHHGADTRAERAKTALGLLQFASDWEAAWDHLRAIAMQAVDTIREEISPLVD
jgi:hypothetical protein